MIILGRCWSFSLDFRVEFWGSDFGVQGGRVGADGCLSDEASPGEGRVSESKAVGGGQKREINTTHT